VTRPSIIVLTLLAVTLPLGAHAQQSDALSCYERAQEETTLPINDAVELCTGASSAGPLECFVQATERTMLSQQQAVILCRCAEDASPVACYEQATANATLTNDQVVVLCAPSIQGTLYPSCEPAGQRYEVPAE